jgi:hypothetical protein
VCFSGTIRQVRTCQYSIMCERVQAVFFVFLPCVYPLLLSKNWLDDAIMYLRAMSVQHLNNITFNYARFVGYKSSYIVLVVTTSNPT